MKSVIDRLRLAVELVTDLVFDSDGNATGNGPDDDELDPVVGYHFGFYSRPNDGARGVVLKADGRGNTSFLIAFRDKQYEMSLQKGEVGIQNAFNVSLLLSQGGNIIAKSGGTTLLDASPSGVKLGPVGTLPVLVQGAMDSMGVPVTQAPAASATIVKAG